MLLLLLLSLWLSFLSCFAHGRRKQRQFCGPEQVLVVTISRCFVNVGAKLSSFVLENKCQRKSESSIPWQEILIQWHCSIIMTVSIMLLYFTKLGEE